MFLGLRTAIYHVDDIDKARSWYGDVLGVKPYFDQPFYVGFNVAGYELGLQPATNRDGDKAASAVAYWAWKTPKRLSSGLSNWAPPFTRKSRTLAKEIKVATVKDPFGNIFGII